MGRDFSKSAHEITVQTCCHDLILLRVLLTVSLFRQACDTGATRACCFVLCAGQVPREAALQKRGYGVRVLILSRNIMRPNDFLGQADVPLSLLQVRNFVLATPILIALQLRCRKKNHRTCVGSSY